MLDANDPTFQQQYPNGAIVRDRLGRQLRGVVACNPVTGEVITCDMGWIAKAWRKALWPKDPSGLISFRFINGRFLVQSGEVLRRHGFHPAPLTIEPRLPALAEWTPAELPGPSCWYSADDGIYVDSKTGQEFLRDLSGNGGRMIVADEVSEAIFIDNH